REIPIREIWWTGDRREGPPDLLAPLEQIPSRVITATSAIESLDGVAIEILAPIDAAENHAIVNDGSIVIRIRYGERAILSTGDAERASEDAMLERCRACLAADVLKAGHHGSKTSTGEAFLEAVHPAHAIVSAGRLNRFGFPHRAVLERL